MSSTCSGCTNLPNTHSHRPARLPAEGDDNDVTPFVGGQLELMTPELPLPLSPRIFAGGGVVAAFGSTRHVASEGNVGTIRSPLPPGTPDLVPFPEEQVIGQGSETRAEIVDDWIYEAHAGVSSRSSSGPPAALKPSAGWIRYEVTRRAPSRCGVPELVNEQDGLQPDHGGALRSIQLRSDDSGIFDASAAA